MKYILLFSLTIISSVAFGKVYNCQSSTEWPNEHSFSATIEVSENNNKFTAKITSLTLSKEWPLNNYCSNPIKHNLLYGSQKRNQITLGTENEKECGFVIYLVTSGNEPSLLSPRQSYKVYGHKPYLAACNAI